MYVTLCVLLEPWFLFTGSSSLIDVCTDHTYIHILHTVNIKLCTNYRFIDICFCDKIGQFSIELLDLRLEDNVHAQLRQL